MSSQYILYSSSDAAGPGLLTGQAGTLIAVLKACLVDGYAGHAAAGWSQPVATAGNIGSFKLGTGSTGLACVINDNGANVTSTFKEAWITGWESVAGVGAPVGSGSGQFPTPAQQLTSGHGVIRKSFSADGIGRAWQLFADAHTAVMFIASGDTAGLYQPFYFGDIYSLKSTADSYRCALIAQHQENSTGSNFLTPNLVNTANFGHFMARTYGGGGTSITCGKNGDLSKAVSTNALDGILQAPNGPDNAYYLSPINVHENVGAILRGRLRGVYHSCHPKATFADGQVITGAGDFAGKTFQVIRDVLGAGAVAGAVLIETSATLETN